MKIMNLYSLLKIEFKKVKRSKILPLIFVAPIIVVLSGILEISAYFTPEYRDPWGAMFIQSCLLYAYYLLPFTMVVVCVLLAGRESANNGILKMLALPVDRKALSIAKFCVLAGFLLLEVAIYLVSFLIAGAVTTCMAGISQSIPFLYLLEKCSGLFFTMLPCIAVMWLITVIFEKPMLSIGLNLLLVIPGVLVANTPMWVAYPYCYSGYLVTCAMADYQNGVSETAFALFPFLPCAVFIFAGSLALSAICFGKKEIS